MFGAPTETSTIFRGFIRRGHRRCAEPIRREQSIRGVERMLIGDRGLIGDLDRLVDCGRFQYTWTLVAMDPPGFDDSNPP